MYLGSKRRYINTLLSFYVIVVHVLSRKETV